MSSPAEIEEAFFSAVRAAGAGPGPSLSGRSSPDDPDALVILFQSMLTSRHLDLALRHFQAEGKAFYTIGSSGHEFNACVAAALRPTDPALLHYRSGGFYVQRASQVPGADAVHDVLAGGMAVTSDPISGGRHKVFGNHALAVIPQTSTIASHLPRAVGVGFAIDRARRMGLASEWPHDAVVVCSFGDASVNHSTAAGALNAAAAAAHRRTPMPVLFVCEDNGLGISVPTPRHWINSRYGHAGSDLPYRAADGSDLVSTLRTAREAVEHVRDRREPMFLHLPTVRLMGHAGSDVESAYRSAGSLRRDRSRDPLTLAALQLIRLGLLTAQEMEERYHRTRDDVLTRGREIATHPHLETAEEVVAPLRLPSRASARPASSPPPAGLTLARAVNYGLAQALTDRPEALVFGEDVGAKGGVYGVTRGLQRHFGSARVFDTILDEQTVLGTALGLGLTGFLPIPEIQYLAYFHNAEDQLRGEAATLPFFSNGQYRNPMLLRIAGYAYQRGFGGHFHNDNSIAVLRDIPGIVIASPAHPDDAMSMLRACVDLCVEQGSVCVFLEPIALYHTRDLHEDGDGGWLSTDHLNEEGVGMARTHGFGSAADLTIVTNGNGTRMSLRVASRLAKAGIGARVVDLRWLAPFPVKDVVREAAATGRVLVVDETRRTGGLGEALAAVLLDHGFRGAVTRVAGRDTFIPLGPAAHHVLVGENDIEAAARRLLAADPGIFSTRSQGELS